MKYAMLIYTKPGSHESLSQDDRASVYQEYVQLGADERCLEGAQLQPLETATTIRVENGETLTTDGPYADTKEFFGGYYVIDVGDLDQAMAFAARIPAARLGGAVEVRPVVQ